MTMMSGVALAGVAVMGLACLFDRVAMKAPASLRHAVWTTALASLLALPAFEAMGIRIEVPVLPSWAVTAPASPEAMSETTTEVAVAPRPSDRIRPSPAARDGVHRVSAAPVASGVPSPRSDRRTVEVAAVQGAEESARVESVSEARSTLPTPTAGASTGFTWIDALTLIWALGALVLATGVLASHVAAYRLTRFGVERPAPSATRRLAALCVELGIRRPVRLVVQPAARVPATWGLRTPVIVLPPQYESWSPESFERVLLHELAHVQRGDCATYAMGALARALHWPNPLAWIAVRRQRAESEHACDDLVLSRGEAASDYAQDLLGLVRSLPDRAALPEASMAMARPAGLGGRVRAVLDPTQSRDGLTRATAFGLVAGTFALGFATSAFVPVSAQQRPSAPAEPTLTATAVPAAPEVPMAPTAPEAAGAIEVPAPPTGPLTSRWAAGPLRQPADPSQELCVFRDEGGRSTNVQSNDDEIRIRWETDGCRVDIEIEGDVEFSSDDTRIESMERGALFEIEERIGRDRKRARFEGTRAGIERRYWVDGDEVDWGREADEWIAMVLPEIFRHTTINAEARVRRMLDEGGADRVFAEAQQIHSDHVLRTYLELMMEAERLEESDYTRVIDFAAEMDSDHGAGELLLRVVDTAGLRPAFQVPMLRAAEGIESDHQKTRVLEALLASDLSPSQIEAVLESASTIESDHNLGMLLSGVARSGRWTDVSRSSFLTALESIESDHNHSMVLETFLDAGTLSDEELGQVLEMTDGLDSDHNRGTILQRIAAEYTLSGPQLTSYLRSAAQLDSDHQVAMTTEVILQRADFSQEHLALVLTMADQVDSDHQRATILRNVIMREELSARELDEVLMVASGLDSDHQLGSTLTLVLEDETLRADGIMAVLDAAARIDSSHQRSMVLVNLAGLYTLDGEQRDRYLELADDLSRSDRDRARSALRR